MPLYCSATFNRSEVTHVERIIQNGRCRVNAILTVVSNAQYDSAWHSPEVMISPRLDAYDCPDDAGEGFNMIETCPKRCSQGIQRFHLNCCQGQMKLN